MGYRSLTRQETDTLMRQGCQADDWANVTVKDGFSAEYVKDATLSGNIRLGRNGTPIEIDKGLSRHTGLYNCALHECEIGDDVFIGNTALISNYIIEDKVVILDTQSITVSGSTSFGNGTEVEILSEAGGRELILFDRLSAQVAYMLVFYRHDPVLIAKLKSLIHAYVSSVTSGTGRIGSYAGIRRAGLLRNVKIGAFAGVSGARLMEEVTIISNKLAPVRIGENVTLRDSIILSGTSVTDGAFLEKCFVGQGVQIGRQFSAEKSAFFANSEAMLGEAGSIFAGPYTVSHHKSTLLLAAMFSFYNAGSGTNVSNHMYKLGPLHQGIVERGSKTGSSSYMLWPCRVGAFNVVVGKHFTNFDTSDFPFSYIVEEKGKSVLYPAMNLFTVGTRRDSEKWPARDRRTDPEKHDLINFDLFNPYIAGKMARAVRLLGEYAEKTPRTQEHVNHKGAQIPRLLLKTARKFYEMALKIYTGNLIVKKIEAFTGELAADGLKGWMKSMGDQGHGAWLDIAGMIAPGEEISKLVTMIRNDGLKSIESVVEKIREIYDQFDLFSWNWCVAYLEATEGLKPDQLHGETLIGLLTEWRDQVAKFNNMILQDAAKEFDLSSRYGYGIDGDESIVKMDFEAVRGTYQENKFVTALKAETERIENKAAILISQLQSKK